MLTQSAPSIVNALAGVLPPNASRALLQSLGNCNQPLAHRGNLQLAPPNPRESGPGYVSGGGWNPQDYADLMPQLGQSGNVDVPGYGAPGGWGSSNYYGDQFNFPVNQLFTTNQYLGGPNVYNSGSQYVTNSYSENITTNNMVTENLEVTNINGIPVAGPAGPAGNDGMNGLPGAPGAPGQAGVVFVGGLGGRLRQTTKRIGPYLVGEPHVPLARSIFAVPRVIRIPATFEIDPETCEVSVTAFDEKTVIEAVNVVPRVPVEGLRQEFAGPFVTNVAVLP